MAPVAVSDTTTWTESPVQAVTLKAKAKPYSQTPETTAQLEWAELVNLDLSLFDKPHGKEALAEQLKYAVQNVGFFYVSNFGIPQDEVDLHFELNRQFQNLPIEEKVKYRADNDGGGYNGFMSKVVQHGGAFKDDPRRNSEMYNIPKFTEQFPGKESHPKFIQNNWDTIKYFATRIHTNVIERILMLFAIVLELPDENHFKDLHRYEAEGEDHFRYMVNWARPKEINAGTEIYTRGHTDLGTISLLFRQPVAGLQILSSDGKYRWVKPVPGTITVNIADTLSLLTGGYFKSSIHRVAVPPFDQQHLDRYGILYFVRPISSTLIEVVKNSPVLEKAGIYENGHKLEKPITVGTWVKARQKYNIDQQIKYQGGDVGEAGIERKDLESDVAGVRVKWWN